MHIFLTGDIQIGKSTVIEKTIKALDIPVGGFITYFGKDRYDEERELYMNAAWLPKEYKKSLSITTFMKNAKPQPNSSAFDIAGVNWIRESRYFAKILIMDECGCFESQALKFQAEIFNCLNQDIPVLGVLKKITEPSWLDKVKVHPKVEVITITKENRDELPSWLIKHFS